MRTMAAVAVFLLVTALPVQPAGAHDASCGGVGPVLVDCTTGEHVLGGQHIWHGPVLEDGPVYTGTIVSYLVSNSGNVKRTCEVFLGEIERCFTDIFSVWPKIGESFVHVCFSYHPGTEIPGGVGLWGCGVEHA